MIILKGDPGTYLLRHTAVLIGMVGFILGSCTVIPKDYPSKKPFVYETNIRLEGNFSKEQRINLESKLGNQLDDSIKVQTVRKFFQPKYFYRGFNRQILENPPLYDTTKAERSIVYMSALLHSLGYFKDSIRFDTTLRVVNKKQYRTSVNFTVIPGPVFRLDTLVYNLTDTTDSPPHPNRSELQQLAVSTRTSNSLKKGDPFAQQLVSDEFDRMVNVYRDKGYLRFTRDELVGMWDTLDVALLNPNLDPFERVLLLDSLKRKRQLSPTANLELRLKDNYNYNRLTKYYNGTISVFPDYTGDSTLAGKTAIQLPNGFHVYYSKPLFRTKFLARNIFIKQGELYNQTNYIKTINRFNYLGAWRLVNIEQLPRPNTDTVDFNIYLAPAEKYSFTTNLEVSNSNNALFQGNLLGLGVNASLVNRNFGRSSNRENISVRYNTELSTRDKFIATQQAGLTYSIFFPKLIPNMKWLKDNIKEKATTQISMSISRTDRIYYFIVNSLSLSMGYNLAWKNKALRITLPNIEYTDLRRRDSLIALINKNPSFKNIFNQGLVFSIQGGFKITGGRGKNINIFSTNLEESGFLVDLFKTRLFDSLYRFLKVDGEFVRSMFFGKKQLVTRVYSGVGIAFKTHTRQDNLNMPYFRQFFPGGPNSMRAWQLRTLGPGSTVESYDDLPLRFGDFMFETNVELRFPFTRIAGYPVTSAVFTDIGNVWFIRPNPDFPDGHLASFNKFIKDLAVGVGTGLRFDFDFLLIRLDYAFKARNPSPTSPESQNKWFYNWTPKTLFAGTLQLGINYPFIRY